MPVDISQAALVRGRKVLGAPVKPQIVTSEAIRRNPLILENDLSIRPLAYEIEDLLQLPPQFEEIQTYIS